MGKSTASQFLRQRGLPLVDTDALAHELVQPGQPALAEIRAVFGEEYIDAEGRLRRTELAQRVFADASARRLLEAILHPRIREQWQARVASWREQGLPAGVVDIPLLFETHSEAAFNATICIACSGATQQRRLLARGWTLAEIEQRVQAQWPTDQKIALADYVVWTESGLENHAAQLDRILATEGLAPIVNLKVGPP
jgi:dephospho-CoA kinase